MSTIARKQELEDQISSLMKARLMDVISAEQYNIAALELAKKFFELEEGKPYEHCTSNA